MEYAKHTDFNIKYDHAGRLEFNAAFHTDQDKPFTNEELAYLCKFYEMDGVKSMSMALGRTEQKISNQILNLKKRNLVNFYIDKWNLIYGKRD